MTTYHLAGTATAGATVSITAPGRDQPYRVTALADGSWSVDVDLRRGRNQFDITATIRIPASSRSPRTQVINVPFSAIQAPTLTVSQPVDGTTYENGAIPVQGTTTNAKTVTVAAAFLGPVGAAAPAPKPTTRPTASGGPGSSSAPAGGTTVAVADDGSFSTPVELTQGRWAITITATSDQGKTASLTRNVTVAYKGVNLVVTINGGPGLDQGLGRLARSCRRT